MYVSPFFCSRPIALCIDRDDDTGAADTLCGDLFHWPQDVLPDGGVQVCMTLPEKLLHFLSCAFELFSDLEF